MSGGFQFDTGSDVVIFLASHSGNVQSGRRCNMDGSLALSTTRLFSSLNLQPYDTRLGESDSLT